MALRVWTDNSGIPINAANLNAMEADIVAAAWAPVRSVPANGDLNSWLEPGVSRISTPDSGTIANMPPGTRVASEVENVTTGPAGDAILAQRLTESGDAGRQLWRPKFTSGNTFGPWAYVGCASVAVTEWHVFLGAGQSNGSGRAIVSAASGGKYMQTRIAQFGFTRRVVETATVPLDMHDTASGLSPFTVFANNYLLNQPESVGVLIVAAAHGGTGFSGSTTGLTWTPGVATNPIYDLPAIAVKQTTDAIAAAKATGAAVTLKGILWHQGEDNTTMSQSSYTTNLDNLIAYFRTQLGDSKLPFVLGQMCPEGIAANAGRGNIDAAHRDTPNRVLYTGFAPATTGGYNPGDTTHMSKFGVDFLGRTYLEAYQAALFNAGGTLPRWKPFTSYSSGQQVVLPDGDVGTPVVPFTSTATYDATNWKPSNSVKMIRNLGGEDINTITAPGIYHQASSSTPTTGLNYPLSGRGRLTVTPVSASIVGQEYWATFLKRLFVREYSGTAWSAWTEIGAAAGGGVSFTSIPLGTEDLNTVTTPGIYGQATSGTATLARNYPVEGSGRGVLAVKNVSASVIAQEYNASFLQRVFYREYNASAWSAWKELGTGTGGGVDTALTARVTQAESNITSINNGQSTQNNRLTTLEAQTGLGNPVTGALINGDGTLSFTLANSTVTAGLPLPANLPTDQVDYVDLFARRSTTSTMLLTKTAANNSVDVSCISPSGKHVTMSFYGSGNGTTSDDYRIASDVWMGDTTGGVPNKTTIIGPVSNKDFAIQVAPAGTASSPQFVPYHGIPTAFAVEPAQIFGSGIALDVSTMAIGESRSITSFEIIQHVYGRHPDQPALNLVELWTSQRISPNGMLSMDGKFRVLSDVTLGSNYFMMCPVTGSLFDTIVSSLNNTYTNTPAKYGTSTYLPIEADVATSYVFLASTNADVGVAFRYNNMAETMRRGMANKNPNSAKTFLEHRNSDFLKLYNRPWLSGTVLPAGTVNRFSGDYMFMQGKGLFNQFSR